MADKKQNIKVGKKPADMVESSQTVKMSAATTAGLFASSGVAYALAEAPDDDDAVVEVADRVDADEIVVVAPEEPQVEVLQETAGDVAELELMTNNDAYAQETAEPETAVSVAEPAHYMTTESADVIPDTDIPL